MKILVLSDSHASYRFMRACAAAIKPAHIIHLGDYYDDGELLKEENPGVIFHQVPGNCDRYRTPPGVQDTLCYDIGGVRILMTHGHRQRVKYGTENLIAQGRVMKAQAALYGHTHVPDCHLEDNGMWVLNPGSCGGSGTAGLIEIENKRITSCRIIRQEDLEGYL